MRLPTIILLLAALAPLRAGDAAPAAGAPGVQVLGYLVREGVPQVCAWRERESGRAWAIDQATGRALEISPAAPTTLFTVTTPALP